MTVFCHLSDLFSAVQQHLIEHLMSWDPPPHPPPRQGRFAFGKWVFSQLLMITSAFLSGVLLRKLEAGIRGISHVIVDEIHERDLSVSLPPPHPPPVVGC